MVIAQLVVGAVGAGGIRADHRRTAALERERKAVASYRLKLGPLVAQVFDAVQPLQDVEDAFAQTRPGLLVARNDVFARGGSGQDLAAATRGR